MKIHHHTAFSVIISGILYMIFKSWSLATACLISGIFIDLDHLIDYFREYGMPFKIKKFFYICESNQLNQAFLILHGWEWLVLFAVSSWLTNWNPWITGTFIGLSQHMVLDELYNRSSLRGYSLLWRWKNNFNYKETFPNNRDVTYIPAAKSKQK